jgi:hypothetical protein
MAGKLLRGTNTHDPEKRLPVRYNLTTLFTLSVIITLLVLIVSIAGIVFQRNIYTTEILINTFVPNDIINLVIGVSYILLSLLLTSRNKIIGLFCWPGALFYFIYVFFPYLICVRPGYLFIPYIIIIIASIYNLIGVLASINSSELQQDVSGRIPARTFGGILIALGVIIILRQTSIIIDSVINYKPINTPDLAVMIDDYMLGSPAMIIGGVLLWKRKSLGYLVGTGLYIVFGILSFGLIPFIIIQSHLKEVSTDIASIVIMLIISAACMIPVVLLLRGNHRLSFSFGKS